MQSEHDRLVSDIAAQVARFHEAGKPFRLFHGSTNSTRVQTFRRDATIDVSQLNHVLSVDTEKMTAVVEPNVPMDKLVEETLKYGLVPPVVMEFPSITVGGGVQGGAGESSSFKHGCFNEICKWYEMVLGDGRVVTVSSQKSSDLYYGTAGSYGTLGVLTATEIRLIPAQKYIELSYLRVSSFDEAIMKLNELAVSDDYDYLDGILFAANRGVILAGKLTNKARHPKQRFTHGVDDWFYLHADKVCAKNGTLTETIPLVDYLFRYDRGAFWTGQFTFERSHVPFNRFTRWLLNPILNARKLYQALQATNAAQQYIVQDMAVPEKNAVKFLDYINKTFGMYPLWLCPLKPDRTSRLLCNHLDTDLAINIGIWLGKQYTSSKEFVTVNRQLEKQVRALEGKKWFYAQSYYPETEFWSIYDRVWYDKLRKKYAATALPTIYDKIISKNLPMRSVKKAALKTLFGRATLRIKD